MKQAPRGFVLAVTTVAVFATSFSASSLNVALPLIGGEFHLGGVALNWVVTAFVLTSAVLVMPFGRLGDLHGRQRLFVAGMAVFALGSLGGAFASSSALLVASRALTGVGAALSFATVTAILVAAYPPAQRGRILGVNVSMVYFGLSAGPVLGGLITQLWGWRFLLGVHGALAAVVLLLCAAGLRGDDREGHAGGFDLVGTALYAVGLSSLLIGFSDLPQVLGVVLSAGGAFVLGVFWWYESRAKGPILPVRLFTENRAFAFSNLAAMISYSATFAVAFFLSLYLQVVRGLPPSTAGLLLIAQPLVQAVTSPLAGRLSDRVAPRLLASVGMGVTAVGLAGLAFLDADTPLTVVLGALVLLGLGFGLFSSPNTNAIMGSVEKKDLGLASATTATMRSVGQMLSMGSALVLLSLTLGKEPVSAQTAQAFLTAQHGGFVLAAVLCALGIAASWARGKGA